VYFLDRSGRRIRRSTRETNKARAHAVAKELERRHADPTHRASDATTIADAVSRFVASLTDAGRSAETCRFYDVKLRHLARVFGASTPLAKVTAASVDDFIQTRLAEGAERYTVSKELTALRGVLKVARRRGEFDKDVGQVLPIAFATGYKPRTRRVTIAEAWTLIRDLPDGTARYMAFVCATTARDAAVYRARGCDLTHVGIRVHDQKTALAARVVPLTAVTEPFARFAFRDLAADDRVCPTGESAMRHAFNRSTARLGWPHLSPNDIRRSVAHWLLEGGVPRDVVAAFMGHASTTMLDRVYGKLEAAEVGAAIARTLRK
jgi:integrase